MNDKQLRSFLAIVAHGSMNRASEALYISQPALKKQLDTLEAECGVRLFERHSQGCKPTLAGKAFLERAEDVLLGMQGLVAAARAAAVQMEVLRICTLPDIALESHDLLCLAFSKRYPEAKIQRVPLPTSQWLDCVESGRADICSCFFSEDIRFLRGRELGFTPLPCPSPLVCIMAPSHPLARQESIQVEELRGFSIFAGPLLYYYGGFKELAALHGLDAAPHASAGLRYEMMDRCAKGAICIHPQGFGPPMKPLLALPLVGLSVQSGWLTRRHPSLAVKRFMDISREKG